MTVLGMEYKSGIFRFKCCSHIDLSMEVHVVTLQYINQYNVEGTLEVGTSQRMFNYNFYILHTVFNLFQKNRNKIQIMFVL